MDITSLFVPMLAGLVGSGMLMYAKSTQRVIPGVAGLGMLVLPYFISSWVAQGVVCAALASVPFLVRD